MNKSGLIVEFLGMSGCGKSTLSMEVYNLLKDEGFNVKNPTYNISSYNKLIRSIIKLYYLLVIILLYPLLTINLFYFILTTGQESIKDFIKVTLNLFYIIRVLTKYKKEDEIILLDQGLLQAFWSINFTSGVKFNSNIFNKIKPFWPDIVIDIEVAKEIVWERLLSRSEENSRIDTSKKAFDDNYNRAQKVFKLIRKKIMDKSEIKWLRIKNNDLEDLEKNKYLVERFIRE